MEIPDNAHLVTNGCEISPTTTYLIDRDGKVYIYLPELSAAVESEYSFACNNNGEPIPFKADGARRLPVLSMEEAVERLNTA